MYKKREKCTDAFLKDAINKILHELITTYMYSEISSARQHLIKLLPTYKNDNIVQV